ncbi:MAG: hypothetical protein IJW24_02270 [Clostridia bacterium]|nr:hypothetical protein [Clostridia bacterium]
MDKAIVPRFFGDYGIYNISDLVGMMSTLYSSPDENKLVQNGFTELDIETAEDKLKNIFPSKENSLELDYNAISEGKQKDGVEKPLTLEFSDKEIAGVLDKMLGLGILARKLPDLEYINTIGINILELSINPEILGDGINPESANIHAIIKFDTTDVREQMASEMGTSMFVLDMVIPSTIYITLDYHLEIADGEWVYSEGNIGVNGRNSEQSEILMNILISFIFPVEDEMDLEKLTHEFGNILQSGLDLLGQAEYTESGIVVTIE